eukprot:g24368.t1
MGTEWEAPVPSPPADEVPEPDRQLLTGRSTMGSDWRRDGDNVTINYNKYWPVSPSDEKQQEHRHSILKKKGYFSAIGQVWRNPTIRSNFGVNQLYSNQFQQ